MIRDSGHAPLVVERERTHGQPQQAGDDEADPRIALSGVPRHLGRCAASPVVAPGHHGVPHAPLRMNPSAWYIPVPKQGCATRLDRRRAASLMPAVPSRQHTVRYRFGRLRRRGDGPSAGNIPAARAETGVRQRLGCVLEAQEVSLGWIAVAIAFARLLWYPYGTSGGITWEIWAKAGAQERA